MRRNVLRELLDKNKPSIGTHVHTLWPVMASKIGERSACSDGLSGRVFQALPSRPMA